MKRHTERGCRSDQTPVPKLRGTVFLGSLVWGPALDHPAAAKIKSMDKRPSGPCRGPSLSRPGEEVPWRFPYTDLQEMNYETKWKLARLGSM